ncbi:MAG TPA: SDR family NAD(P)-dependent oxidoreductase [Acidimicrobiales bacterium]|nr:SDR family NAD(P)-dependent oxidoreductase [Acidimicrobiales bacterium]
MKAFQGRVAVVTGAASGIGYAMAERFAAEGMKVVLADVQADALEEAEGAFRAGGAEVLAVETDVAQPAALDHLRDRALAAFGAVHLLCNNAGVASPGTVWEASPEDWSWVLGVNLLGVVNGLRSLVPVLLEQEEAHIVNTASIAGLITGVLGSYSVTKQAVVGLSEALQLSLAMRGADHVGVSVLCPGWVRTRIGEASRNRPASAGSPSPMTPELEAAEQMMRYLVDTGADPAAIAGQVVDAIRERRFYTLTHPEMNGAITARFDDILAGRPPRLPDLT